MVPTLEYPAGSDEPPREEKSMYPGMMYWWRSHHGSAERRAFAGCDPMGRGQHGHERAWRGFHVGGMDHDDLGAAAFGVRRPLRFLAFKLDLDESQVTELAAIMNDLKTER